tara:strand:- start:215 stop:736 length:522 start_codon:yes stop_codon:yes gene_type:complete
MTAKKTPATKPKPAPRKKATKPVKKTGEEIIVENFFKVCDLIAEEGKSLRESCLVIGMHRRDFHNLVNKDDEKFDHYARAREYREDVLLDEIYSIADDSTFDTVKKVGKDGKEYEEENREWVNRSKMRVDVRKWHLSKMNPKKFGDKLELDGKLEGMGIVINMNLGDDEEESK